MKKKNGEDYEPESLKGIKKNPVWIDIFLAKSIDIALLVQTNLNPEGRFWWLKADSLKKEGKGRRPNRAQSISDEEERVTIFSIIHTLRYIMYFHN